MRHPIYTGLFIGALGETLAYFSPRNLLLTSLGVFWFVIKSFVEESFLSKDAAYAAYMQCVRYRWIPGVVLDAGNGQTTETSARLQDLARETEEKDFAGGHTALCVGNRCSAVLVCPTSNRVCAADQLVNGRQSGLIRAHRPLWPDDSRIARHLGSGVFDSNSPILVTGQSSLVSV